MSDSTNFPSIRGLISFAGNLLSQIPLGSHSSTSSPAAVQHKTPYIPFGNIPSCPANSPLSCHNSTVAPDSCCFIHPGGQLLQTQFWDVRPSIGPEDSWTLHGLWYVSRFPLPRPLCSVQPETIKRWHEDWNRPDLCDGSYPSYCTAAPRYYNISSILTEASQTDLLEDMNTFWLPNSGTPENFWQHEWNKHGTCVNTLAPSCYGEGYNAGDEVVDFFTRAVALFKVFPLSLFSSLWLERSSCSEHALMSNRNWIHIKH